MEDLKKLESILSSIDRGVDFVAKKPVKIGNKVIMKEPALRHHFDWLESLRQEQIKIMNSHHSDKIEVL